jgi:hypothetical protein
MGINLPIGAPKLSKQASKQDFSLNGTQVKEEGTLDAELLVRRDYAEISWASWEKSRRSI